MGNAVKGARSNNIAGFDVINPVFHTDVDQVFIHSVPIKIIPSKETNFEYQKRSPKFV